MHKNKKFKLPFRKGWQESLKCFTFPFGCWGVRTWYHKWKAGLRAKIKKIYISWIFLSFEFFPINKVFARVTFNPWPIDFHHHFMQSGWLIQLENISSLICIFRNYNLNLKFDFFSNCKVCLAKLQSFKADC